MKKMCQSEATELEQKAASVMTATIEQMRNEAEQYRQQKEAETENFRREAYESAKRHEAVVNEYMRREMQANWGEEELIKQVAEKAEEVENNSNQLLNFTNLIKKNTTEVKSDIIEHLWKIIISDNSIDQYESNLMRRICGLIYFPDKMCGEIKLKLLNDK